MNKCFLMVGLPGSGKSTWIKNNLDGDAIICSADHYHTRRGQYSYDVERAAHAHDLCLSKFQELLLLQPKWSNTLVVDNTNLTPEYLVPYYSLARIQWRMRGLDLRIIWINVSIERARAQDTHGVPLEVFDRMVAQEAKLLSRWPKHWTPIEEAYDHPECRRLPTPVDWKDASTH